MVQTVHSITVLAEEKKLLIQKPLVLHRIFFSIRVFAPQDEFHEVKISFDDPHFNSFYVLDGSARYFQAEGEDIFQGNVWVFNVSSVNLLHTTTEILH